jgi:hypothetical protein
MTPEEKAREQIDLLLQQAGWMIQDRSQINLAAGPGVAIREVVLETGLPTATVAAGWQRLIHTPSAS